MSRDNARRQRAAGGFFEAANGFRTIQHLVRGGPFTSAGRGPEPRQASGSALPQALDGRRVSLTDGVCRYIVLSFQSHFCVRERQSCLGGRVVPPPGCGRTGSHRLPVLLWGLATSSTKRRSGSWIMRSAAGAEAQVVPCCLRRWPAWPPSARSIA